MTYGDHTLVILNEAGEPIGSRVRSCPGWRPNVGETVTIDKKLYLVAHVSHEEDPDSRAGREESSPTVFVRRCHGTPPGLRRPEPAKAKEPRVLHFDLPPVGAKVTGAILPASMIAAIVWCGYRAQATYYKACVRYSAKLIREGTGWYVDLVGYERTKSLRGRAKQNLGKLECLLFELSLVNSVSDSVSCDPVPLSPSPDPEPSRLDLPPISSPPPKGRARLRLV